MQRNSELVPKPNKIPRSFHLEADRCVRGMSVVISGVVGISDFKDDRVLLKTHSGRVTVSGKKLNVIIFEQKSVEISGKVMEISFGYGKV